MSNDRFLYEVNDGIATVILNEPDRLNPLSLPLQRRPRKVLAQIREDRAVRALVLTGAGKAFCVGADLHSMNADTTQGKSLGNWTADAMEEVSNPLIADLRTLPVPTVAAVNGVAAGAGVGIALACDIAIAAHAAYFYLPFAPRLGIVPDLGATWFLPRVVGHARALGWTLLGDQLPAERAAQWGLVWACVEDAALYNTVRQIAQRLAALPAHVTLEARRAYEASHTNDLMAQLHYEAGRQRELIDRDPFTEAVRAFLDKRTPIFKGR